MTSTADDPLQTALDEATTLMSALGSSSGDGDAEDVVDVSIGSSGDLHPLHDNFLDQQNLEQYQQPTPQPSQPNASQSPALYPSSAPKISPPHPQQQQQQQHPSQGMPPMNMNYQQHPMMNQSSPPMSMQPSQPMMHPHSTPMMQQHQQSPSGMNSQQQQQYAPALDSFKAQTRTFASNLATMAQRGFTHIAHDMNRFANSTDPSQTNNSSHNSSFPVTPTTPSTTATSSTSSNHRMMTTTSPMTPQQESPATQSQLELDPEQRKTLLQTHVGDLLPGETIILFVTNLTHVSDSTGFTAATGHSMWCGVMTYYRWIVFSTHPSSEPAPPSTWHPAAWVFPETTPSQIELPLTCIDKVEKNMTTTQQLSLTLTSKENGRFLRVACQNYSETLKVAEAIQTYAFPGRRNLGYLFAFECKREEVMNSIVTEENGQKRVTLEPTPKRFDPMQEYTRFLGSNHPAWSVWTQVNAQYQICASYPSVVVGPTSIDEDNPAIRQCAAFRSEGRWPVLTWGTPSDGASIWRCAQPKMGLQGNRSSADEYYLSQIMEQAGIATSRQPGRTSSGLTRAQLQTLTGGELWWPDCSMKILDLRPRAAAMANRTAGYGYENTSHYPGTTLQFCNIGNIHAVRDAYQKVSSACLTAPDLQWTSAIEDSKWLQLIRLIWASAWETAYWVHIHRMPVLLHCSHGWDRTSQTSALAQLLLDDHYRTRAGFAKLVDKDFLSFGHPFHTRCAHGEGGTDPSGDEGQVSPIFIQFIDCVYQIVWQFPDCFEFNVQYLYLLSCHVYSCRFGTFLCDTEREREVAANLRQRTHSVWDYLESREDTKNKAFQPTTGVLLMPLPLLLRGIRLWNDRHAMHGMKPVLRTKTNELEVDMWIRIMLHGSSSEEAISKSTEEESPSAPAATESEVATSFTIDDDE